MFRHSCCQICALPEAIFYLIGAGKVQYIQSFSGTGEETCKHKNVVTDPRKEPTCTETGLTEGRPCGDCNAVLVEQKVLPVAGHKEVIDPAVAPTETTPGKTEGKHCSISCSTKRNPANREKASRKCSLKGRHTGNR